MSAVKRYEATIQMGENWAHQGEVVLAGDHDATVQALEQRLSESELELGGANEALAWQRDKGQLAQALDRAEAAEARVRELNDALVGLMDACDSVDYVSDDTKEVSFEEHQAALSQYARAWAKCRAVLAVKEKP